MTTQTTTHPPNPAGHVAVVALAERLESVAGLTLATVSGERVDEKELAAQLNLVREFLPPASAWVEEHRERLRRFAPVNHPRILEGRHGDDYDLQDPPTWSERTVTLGTRLVAVAERGELPERWHELHDVARDARRGDVAHVVAETKLVVAAVMQGEIVAEYVARRDRVIESRPPVAMTPDEWVPLSARQRRIFEAFDRLLQQGSAPVVGWSQDRICREMTNREPDGAFRDAFNPLVGQFLRKVDGGGFEVERWPKGNPFGR